MSVLKFAENLRGITINVNVQCALSKPGNYNRIAFEPGYTHPPQQRAPSPASRSSHDKPVAQLRTTDGVQLWIHPWTRNNKKTIPHSGFNGRAQLLTLLEKSRQSYRR